MATVFNTLFDLAVDLLSDPTLARLTKHKGKSRSEAEKLLSRSILQGVMPGEGIETRWQRARIFCLNFVNRAQPPVSAVLVKQALDNIQFQHPADDDRLAALENLSVSQLSGSRPQEFIDAIKKLLSSRKISDFQNQTYFDWLDQRWVYWSGQDIQNIKAEDLLSDVYVLCKNENTKIDGMGIPLAANLFADLGLLGFVKPDLHVLPIVCLLRLSIERGEDRIEEAFLGGIEIAKHEDLMLIHNRRFTWLREAGGLWPRRLDRLIYLIGSDNFALDGTKLKNAAPKRRALMRKALIQSGLVNGQYA